MADSTLLAASVVTQLRRHITDVVICPGSRNSPLTLALIQAPGLKVHMRIDERAAAFCALGIARATGRHVAVVTTSGTAVANCLPAMVESAYSHTPLLMLSADRPRRVVGRGASQTIDQVGLFSPVAETIQIEGTADITEMAQRLNDTTTVHVNVALDEPLLPEELPAADTSRTLRLAPFSPFVDHGEVELDLSKDTLVIAGDEAWEVEGLEDLPTIAEPTAPAPFHPVHPLAAHLFERGEIATEGSSDYADYIARTKPEQIVVVGHPTLHRPVLRMLADTSIDITVLSRTETITDPHQAAARVGTRVKTTGQPRKQWLRICQALSDAAAEAVRETLADPELGFTGLHVAAAVTDGIGVGDGLVLGASNPVRDAAMTGLPFGGVDTYSPRGAAGIDGTVSQAIGIALARQSAAAAEVRAPRTVALMGDLTFLHDIGGLLIGPDEPRPENLTIVVANDDGGGIFESLEIGGEIFRSVFERSFATPHEADLGSLCAGYGVEHTSVETLTELLVALEDAADNPRGIVVIEARTTRSTRRELDQALRKALGV